MLVEILLTEEENGVLVQRIPQHLDGGSVERTGQIDVVDLRSDRAGHERDGRRDGQRVQGRSHAAARFSTKGLMPSVISAESPGTMNNATSLGRSCALRSRLIVARATGPVRRICS